MSEYRPITGLKPAVCAGCSCLCDDIEMGFGDDGVWSVEGVCSKGQELLKHAWKTSPPVYKVGSQTVDLSTALQAARELLKKSRMPLVTGLSGVGMECQQVALRLARHISGVVDVDCDPDRSRQFSFQRTGGVSATMGEVNRRSDVVIFWGFNPTLSHPRLFERCGIGAKKIIVVGPDDWTAGKADHFVPLPTEQAANGAAVCHAITLGLELDPLSVLESTGVSFEAWQALIDRLNQACYVACFSEAGVAGDGCWNVLHDRLSDWSIAMNRETRFVCLCVGHSANRLAAENVLTMSTGFSSAVSLIRKQPESNYLEYATENMLGRDEVDSVLLVSAAGFERMTDAARGKLNRLPKIFFRDEWSPAQSTDLEVHAEDVWVEAGGMMIGDWARMDDVLLPFEGGDKALRNPAAMFMEQLLDQY